MSKSMMGYLLRIFTLAIWIIIFMSSLNKMPDGTRVVHLLLSPRYTWLVYLALLFFAFFLIDAVWSLFNGDDDPFSPKQLDSLLWLFIPLVLLPLSFKQSLGVTTLEKRNLQALPEERSDPADLSAAVQPLPNLQVPKSEPTLTELLSQWPSYEGREVSIVGMVYKAPDMQDDRFYLFRFSSVCCAADASPLGVLVEYDAPLEFQSTEQWVKVRGITTELQYNDGTYPGLKDVSVEFVNPPAQPLEYAFF